MADDDKKSQQQDPLVSGTGPIRRPPADPDLSDYYQRLPSPGSIENISHERRIIMSDDNKDQDQRPEPPKRPEPDPDLSDRREIEDKRSTIALEESQAEGDD